MYHWPMEIIAPNKPDEGLTDPSPGPLPETGRGTHVSPFPLRSKIPAAKRRGEVGRGVRSAPQVKYALSPSML